MRFLRTCFGVAISLTQPRTIAIIITASVVAAVVVVATIGLRQRQFPPADLQKDVATQLSQVQVISERPTVLGYERDKFGDWAGTSDCNTRTKVLVTWFGGSPCSPDTRKTISDPYSGEMITAEEVDIDHVFPLSAAWDFGAATWSTAQMRTFANDMFINLVPTSSEINREKSDLTPAQWMPPSDYSCDYAHRYLTVAISWGLPISYGDWIALARSCSIATE